MSGSEESQKKYKGVRCRKWGKWVSEIRVPGTQDRLWLGSYSTPEAAAVAHDVAYFRLRGPSSSWDNFNFPHMLPLPTTSTSTAVQTDVMSPRSIQKAASDAGMAIDAQLITNKLKSSDKENDNGMNANKSQGRDIWEGAVHSSETWNGSSESGGEAMSVSVDDYL
ncbi:hypothetical protein L1049_025604 [Liquidambar formosana]|uniref:AP2/ERF domain-containing protein n=1 Tax=Liquidambar formosana TaxID=63359 RepID=A0AAP0R8J5_LIQFO